jgi:hypothetical protein
MYLVGGDEVVMMDTSEIITSSNIDGLHFEKGEHRKLGEAVALKVKDIL